MNYLLLSKFALPIKDLDRCLRVIQMYFGQRFYIPTNLQNEAVKFWNKDAIPKKIVSIITMHTES